MKVLITGAAGVIGKELASLLLDPEYELLVTDKQPLFTDGLVGNLLDDRILKNIKDFNPDLAFHLAAVFERTYEETDYWKTSFENNVLASHKLLRVVPDAKFIFASSYLVYNDEQYLNSHHPVRLFEHSQIYPRNAVGAAKFFTEQELIFGGYNHVSARIWRVYGNGSKDVISRMIRAALRKQPFKVYGLGAMFDYIHAQDVAKGLLNLGLSDITYGSVNLGTGRFTMFEQVLSILSEKLDASYIYGRSLMPIEKCYANIEKLKQYTNWEPSLTVSQGIDKVIEYEREKL